MPPKYKYAKKTTYANKPTSVYSHNLTTAKYLIIVESPSKCSKIETYLGVNYCCVATKGHLRCLNGLRSVDTKSTFKPTFSEISEKKAHIKILGAVIEKFSPDCIFLGSDDDREGEAIAWHICDIFGLSIENTKRIIFHEVTKPALETAIVNPVRINMKLVNAQHARQVLDVIVGYKISPYLWKYIYRNKENSLSAGRCQTPALRLVYDNEKQVREIEATHKITGTFFTKRITFSLSKEMKTEEQVLNHLEKSKKHIHKLQLQEPKDLIKSAPVPFHTSRLLQTANNTLGYSPSATMQVCQRLYQDGFITYMRTESTKYSETFLKSAKEYIISEYGSPSYVRNDEKLKLSNENNPHEAIRVTNIKIRDIGSCNDTRLQTLYNLIWKNTVESCMSDASYKSHKITISAPENTQYTNIVNVPVFIGWRKVFEKDDEDVNATLLFYRSVADADNVLQYHSINSEVVVHTGHKHYTESSLIRKLEELGIGRPSTFASIVETIKERGYVLVTDIKGETHNCNEYKLSGSQIEKNTTEKVFGNEKNKLVIQDVGALALEFLVSHFENLFSYDYTRTMEDKLDDIVNNSDTKWQDLCRNCYQDIKLMSADLNNLTKQTYPIEPGYIYMIEKYGPVIQHTTETGNIEYIPVKKSINVDFARMKEGKYSVEELRDYVERSLGEHKDKPILLKRGPYGIYASYDGNTFSMKTINKEFDEYDKEDVISLMEKPKHMNILRELNAYTSVRRGKHGAYVFHQTPKMKKPSFFNIKKCPHGFLNSSEDDMLTWLQDTYNIEFT